MRLANYQRRRRRSPAGTARGLDSGNFVVYVHTYTYTYNYNYIMPTKLVYLWVNPPPPLYFRRSYL